MVDKTSRLSLMAGGWLLALAAALGPARPTAAVDFQWVGGSGRWSDAFNWAPFGIPDSSSDSVTIRTNSVLPFQIEVDRLPLGAPIILGGFNLDDPNATLRPGTAERITVVGGTANLLRGRTATRDGQSLEIEVRSATLNVGDPKSFRGPATFIATGQNNAFRSQTDVLSSQQQLVVRSEELLLAVNPGRLQVQNELLTNFGTIVLDPSAQSDAALILADGSGKLINARDGVFTGSGPGTGTLLRVQGDTVNRGTLALPDGKTLQIHGELTQPPEGVTRIETAGSFDRPAAIQVSGPANLAGLLDLQFVGLTSPAIGQTLPLVRSAGGIGGAFGRVGNLRRFLASGIGVRLDYLRATGPETAGGEDQLVVTAHGCGDADGDGGLVVDDFDLQEILAQWNVLMDAGVLPDMNGDGLVGIADLNQVLSNYAEVAAPAPEPGTIVSLVLAVAVGTGRRRNAWASRARRGQGR